MIGFNCRDQLRAALAHRPRVVAVLAHLHSRVQRDVRQDLLPELREEVVDDDDLQEARVAHFEDVFVLERRRRPFGSSDGALPCCFNVSFTFCRLSNWMLFSRTATVCRTDPPTVAMAGAPGPVTTISLTSLASGS